MQEAFFTQFAVPLRKVQAPSVEAVIALQNDNLRSSSVLKGTNKLQVVCVV
jgi:hypothetical protein